jgi:hypothetical protein
MPTQFADNALCSCAGNDTCASCLFCERYNTTPGRKALCEKIVHFLAFEPFYQAALAQAVEAVFPGKIIYDDEQDICAMLFEAVLFEDNRTGTTPFAYFLRNAPLSANEKRLYGAWAAHTRYEFFAVEKVIRGKEVHLSDLPGELCYRVYEHRGSITMKEGMVVVARIVPFLKGWMITTESVISYSGRNVRERLQKAHGTTIPQLVFVQRYNEDRKRRMAG